MVVGTFLESVEPDESTDHEDEDSVNDEDPVEEVEAAENMVWLHNCTNRDDP